jgi:hypothetical protein
MSIRQGVGSGVLDMFWRVFEVGACAGARCPESCRCLARPLCEMPGIEESGPGVPHAESVTHAESYAGPTVEAARRRTPGEGVIPTEGRQSSGEWSRGSLQGRRFELWCEGHGFSWRVIRRNFR